MSTEISNLEIAYLAALGITFVTGLVPLSIKAGWLGLMGWCFATVAMYYQHNYILLAVCLLFGVLRYNKLCILQDAYEIYHAKQEAQNGKE